MERVNIIDVEISATNIDECIRSIIDEFAQTKGKYICAANVHTTVYAKENEEYRGIQNNSFLTLPDGKPLSIIGRKKGYFSMERVTGPDFFEKVLQISNKQGWKHFFYGNTKENLKTLIDNISEKYPDVHIVGYESSVFRELSLDEENELVDRINKKNPDFVWVGLGAPMQEMLCSKLCSKTESLWIGVGGAFNVIAGIIPRAPKWMQNYGLEWLFRLVKEPRRLFKRYLISNSKFLFYIILQYLNRKKIWRKID